MTRHRPLVSVALGFGLGIWMAHHLALDRLHLGDLGWALAALFALGAAGWVASRLLRRRSGIATALVLATVVALGTLRYAQDRLPIAIYHQKARYLEQAAGVVADYPSALETRTRFRLQLDHDAGFVEAFYLHPDHAPPPIHYGDRLLLRGGFQTPEPIGTFDYPEYLAAQGVWATATLTRPEQMVRLEAGQGHPVLRWGERVRDDLFSRIDAHLSAPQAAAFKALLFGERAALSEEIEQDFRDAGVAHVLAVSGLHLVVLMALFWNLLRGAGLTANLTYLLIAVLVGVYLLLVGFKASMVRAVLLFGFMAIANVFKERGWIISSQVDSLQGLSMAALVILFLQPQALFEVGFQLSFAATAAILLAAPLLAPLHRALGLCSTGKTTMPVRTWQALRRGVVTTLAVSLAAQLGVLPIIAAHFHQLYLGALLSNLWVVPLSTLVLWVSVGFVAALWAPGVAAWIAPLQEWLLAALTTSVALLARLPGMSVQLPGFPLALVLPYFAVFVAGVVRLQRRVDHAGKRVRASASASTRS